MQKLLCITVVSGYRTNITVVASYREKIIAYYCVLPRWLVTAVAVAGYRGKRYRDEKSLPREALQNSTSSSVDGGKGTAE